MSTIRTSIFRTIAVLVIVGLIALVFALASRRSSSSTSVIQVTPDISLQLAGVLTKANPEYSLPGSRFSLPPKYIAWKPVRFLNRFLPPGARIAAQYTITDAYLKPDQVKLIYLANYPQSWHSSRAHHDIEQDIRKALERKKFKSVEVKIAEGTRTLEREYVNIMGHSRFTGPRGSADKLTCYFTTKLKVPPFLKNLELEFGDYEYNSESGSDIFTAVASDTITNPIYQPVTPLQNPVPQPATQREGDYEVTLDALVSRVKPGANLNSYHDSDKYGLAYETGKPVIENGTVLLDHFPKGTATDPAGYHSTLILSVRKNGAIENEWSLQNPIISYGQQAFEVARASYSSHFNGALVLQIPGDLSVYPGPVKVTTQLKHTSNYLPDETDTIELALPKEGEVLKPNEELATWNRKVKILSIGYKTTQTLAAPVTAFPASTPHMSPQPVHPDTFFVYSEGQGNPTGITLKGPGGASYDVHGFKSGYSINNTYLQQYTLEPYNYGRKPSEKTFNYSDYTTLSLTLTDGRTSPTLYEFITTPKIATGNPDLGKQ